MIRGATVVKDREITWPPPKIADPSPAPAPADAGRMRRRVPEKPKRSFLGPLLTFGIGGLALLGLGAGGAAVLHWRTSPCSCWACFVGLHGDLERHPRRCTRR